MPTMAEDRYEVRLDGLNVLLFRVVPDGSASLLAVTKEVWDRAVVAEQPEGTWTDTAQRLFAQGL